MRINAGMLTGWRINSGRLSRGRCILSSNACCVLRSSEGVDRRPSPSSRQRRVTCVPHKNRSWRPWRKHFSDLEGGVRVSAQELVDFGIASQQQTGAMEILQAAEIPDLVKLAATFRDVNPQKACGPDMIPPSLCRGFASQMSVLFYPVLLKTLAYISEPIGMKGGSLFRIPKPGAADTASCSSQRAILVQSVLEKVLHKSVRGLTVRELELKAPALLIGGRKGLSYTMGFFCARSFLEFTRRKQITCRHTLQ